MRRGMVFHAGSTGPNSVGVCGRGVPPDTTDERDQAPQRPGTTQCSSAILRAPPVSIAGNVTRYMAGHGLPQAGYQEAPHTHVLVCSKFFLAPDQDERA